LLIAWISAHWLLVWQIFCDPSRLPVSEDILMQTTALFSSGEGVAAVAAGDAAGDDVPAAGASPGAADWAAAFPTNNALTMAANTKRMQILII
jgi:hypothetical protein